MTVLVRLVADYAPYLYIALALGILLLLRVVWTARRERDLAIFTLEREAAISKGYRATLVILVLVLLMAAVYYVSQVLAAQLPLPAGEAPTATPILFLTPTATPAPPTATPTATSTPRPRPTPPPPPTDTPPPLPVKPTIVPADCPNPGVRITSPGVNAALSGVVQIVGTASINNFQYYKFEYRLVGSPEWTFLQRFDIPIIGGVLGAWDTSTVSPGRYELRLVVVDITGNYPSPCVVPVTVSY
jgi:hypothetical protein